MKTIFMTKEQWEKWDNALRSGEYKQAKSAMFNKDTGGYCCIGVLQKVLSGCVEHDGGGYPRGLPTTRWLVDNGIRFRDQYGKPCAGPWLGTARDYATKMNDEGANFIDLAEHIQQAVQFTDRCSDEA